MSCFQCFTSQRSKKLSSRHDDNNNLPSKASKSSHGLHSQQKPLVTSSAKDKANHGEDNKHINAQAFTFRELATATNNFRQECLLGEGGFGRVFRGTIKTSGQVVAVKQLDRNGMQGNKEEFLAEVLTLSLLHNPNLVNLIGYCADGEQRLLVFEFMPGGSLEDHLLDITPDKNPLDWYTRIKIAFGIATGLEYLHVTACPPVIYRDLKSSNVLLDDDLNPKLSDFGGGKLGDKSHVSSRVMGTYGYSAPEYTRIGHVTLKSDIYSYGVVLLELITGRRAIDPTRPIDEQNLVSWAQPFFRDPKKFPDLADPLLGGQFPEKDLNQAVAIAAMCLQDEPSVRPLISDVVMTLSFLATKPSPEAPIPAPVPTPPPVALMPPPPEEGESSSRHQQKYDEDEEEEEEESGSQSQSGSEGESSEEEEEEEEGESSGASDYEDVKSGEGSRTTTNAESKKWPSNASISTDSSLARASDAELDREDDEGSVSSSRASSSGASSRESSSGSKTGPVISAGSRSSKSRRTHGKTGGQASYRRSITRESMASSNGGGGSQRTRRRRSSSSYKVAAGESGKFTVSRNNSEVSIGMMSACHEHSFSLGSQDGFVSLQNISSLGSMDDGSVHSSS